MSVNIILIVNVILFKLKLFEFLANFLSCWFFFPEFNFYLLSFVFP